MSRRLVGIVAALVMALFGTALLVSFVKNAEARALAGEELVPVLVVDQPVPAGASPEELELLVRTEQVPRKVRAAGALHDLEQVAGLVTEIAMMPGEQLVSTRFVEPDLLTAGSFAVPEGLLEVTVSLDPQRAVGGALLPGDTVSVVASFEPFEIGAPPGPDPEVPQTVLVDGVRVAGDAKTPNSTALLLTSVLVTNVQLEELPQVSEEEAFEGNQRTLAPTGNLLITLALAPSDAERVLFGAEHGSLWLAGQRSEVDLTGTGVQTRGRVHGGALSVRPATDPASAADSANDLEDAPE